MIKLILNRYLVSYKDYLEKFSQNPIILRIVIIPVFTLFYLLTFVVLFLIVSLVIFLAKPMSLVYKPHTKQ